MGAPDVHRDVGVPDVVVGLLPVGMALGDPYRSADHQFPAVDPQRDGQLIARGGQWFDISFLVIDWQLAFGEVDPSHGDEITIDDGLFRLEALDGATEGLLTGYYEPLVSASRQATASRRVPLHQAPADLGQRKPQRHHLIVGGRDWSLDLV